jgi:putative peptidoglycan lipid II flippase
MAGILFAGYQTDTFWLEAPFIDRLVWLSGLITISGIAYGVTLFLLGFRPKDFRKT